MGVRMDRSERLPVDLPNILKRPHPGLEPIHGRKLAIQRVERSHQNMAREPRVEDLADRLNKLLSPNNSTMKGKIPNDKSQITNKFQS